MGLNDTLKNEPDVKVRMDLKAAEMAKTGTVTREAVGSVDIEVSQITAVKGGLMTLVRSWRNGSPVGFGKNGTVEIERIFVYNPPILVPDPAGTIVQTFAKTTSGRTPAPQRYREDMKAALMESLRQAIMRAATFDSKNIVKGKVGNTTSTFRSVAGANDPVDGNIARSGVDQTFGNICTGNGTTGDAALAALDFGVVLSSSSTTNQYGLLGRSIYLFDTSAIDPGDTVSAASLTMTGDVKNNPLGSHEVVVVASAPAANNAVANGDFQTMSKTALSATVAYASLPTAAGTVDFILNASGLAAIAKGSGRTKLGLMMEWDRAASFGGSWTSSVTNYWDVYYADQSGTTRDPLLTVVHAVAASTLFRQSVGRGINRGIGRGTA